MSERRDGLDPKDLGRRARDMGRAWAEEEARGAGLTFAPLMSQASSRLDQVLDPIRKSMAAEMVRAATERRNELLAIARAVAPDPEADARASADADATKAEVEWQERQKAAAAEKLAKGARPAAPVADPAPPAQRPPSTFGAEARQRRAGRAATTIPNTTTDDKENDHG